MVSYQLCCLFCLSDDLLFFFFRPKKPIEDLVGSIPDDGLDLLQKLLVFNPDKRLTAEQSLSHTFVSK